MNQIKVAYPDLLPPLGQEEFEALKADIAKRGIMVPVELDSDTGEILDGYHRLRACQELGIEKHIPSIQRSFKSEPERKEHALKLNILRRQMDVVTWAEAFEKLLQAKGIKRTPGPKEDSATVALIAKEVGVPRRTAFRRLQTAEKLAIYPDLKEKVRRGKMEGKRALRVVREREAAKRIEEAPLSELPPTIDIRHCDVRLLEFEPYSADLVFTDPPYGQEHFGAWSELSAFAAKILKPDGMLVTYAGQFWLPQILSDLSSELDYLWLGAIAMPGQHNQVSAKNVRNAVKPLLFFRPKEASLKPKWFHDFYLNENRAKENHPWEQSIGPAKYFINELTDSGGFVVDPFLGSGTTAVAARSLNRRFLGCDVDEKAVKMTRLRLANGDV